MSFIAATLRGWRYRVERIGPWRPGRLARNTVVMTAGLGVRTVLQVALFVGLARTLDVDGYGAFVATLAIVTLFMPMIGAGTGILLVREVARDPGEFPRQLGRALVSIILTAPPIFGLAVLLGMVILPADIPRPVLISLAAAELLAAPIVELSARCYQPFEHMGRMAGLQVGLVALRLLALAILFLIHSDLHLVAWACGYAAATAFAALAALTCVIRDLGSPRWSGLAVRTALSEGLPFALGGAAGRVHAEADKAMLARLDSVNAAGLYSAAYRVAELALLPIHSFLGSAFARLCREGRLGLREVARLAVGLLPVPAVYALLSGVFLFFLADIVPWVLGTGFAESAEVLQWLAGLPFLALLRITLVTIAGAAGYQRMSGGTVILGGLTNVFFNLWLIPQWGWWGAVAATYVAEATMSALLFLGLAAVVGSETKQARNHIAS